MDIARIDYMHNDVNFSAAAVTAQSVDEWVDMASKQYWQEIDEKERKKQLKIVYTECQKKIKEALAVKGDTPTPVNDNSDVITNNTVKQDDGNNPDKVGASS